MTTRTNHSPPFDDIAALAKANNDAYLAAYRAGYDAGWRAALNRAVQIIEGPTAPTSEIPTIEVPAIHPRKGES